MGTAGKTRPKARKPSSNGHTRRDTGRSRTVRTQSGARRSSRSGNRLAKRRIAQVGDFDVESLGNLLFPLLAREQLGKYLSKPEVVLYGHGERRASEWPFDVRSLRHLADEIEEFDLLLVGGGEIVRFDDARNGSATDQNDGEDATSLWMGTTLLAASRGVPIVWNAVGVAEDCPAWAHSLTRSALAATEYVSVRDGASAQRLASVAPEVDVRVLPDTRFGIKRLLSPTSSAEHRALLDKLGIDRYIVLQPSPALAPYAARLNDGFEALHNEGWTILELPIAPILGDRAGATGIEVPTVTPPVWPSPTLAAELIARSSGAIGVSGDLVMVASCNGVPVSLPASQRKAIEAEHPNRADPARIQYWSDSGDDPIVPLLVAGRRKGLSPPASQQLTRHWERVAKCAGREGRPQDVSGALLSAPPQLIRAEQDRQRLTAALKVADEDREALRRRLEELHAESVSATAAMETIEAEQAERRSRLTSVEQDRDKLRSEVQHLAIERDRLRAQVGADEQEKKRLQERIESLANNERERSQELGRLQGEISASEVQRGSLHSSLIEAQAELSEQADSLAAAVRQENALRESLDSQARELAELSRVRDELSQSKRERTTLRTRVDEAETRATDLAKALEDAGEQERELGSLRDEISKSRDNLDEAERERETLASRVEAAESEASDLRRALKTAGDQVSDSERERETLASRVEAAESEASDLRRALKTAGDQVSDSERERETLASRVEAAESEASDLRRALVTTGRRERELRDALTAQANDRSQLERELVRAEGAIAWVQHLEGSRSWRLTAPLRRIGAVVRRIFGQETVQPDPPPASSATPGHRSQ